MRLSRLILLSSVLLLTGCSVVADRVTSTRSYPVLTKPSTAESSAEDISLAPFTLVTLSSDADTHFGAFAGGGAPSYNEIALEKNLLYFQRSLQESGLSVEDANLFFASGDDQSTIRYLDEQNEEQFKPAAIPNLDGSSNRSNLVQWLQGIGQTDNACPSFLYFTGHGAYNEDNPDNNALILWSEDFFSVQELASQLDDIPPEQAAERPFVTMMAQCYAGSFANIIYEKGNPSQPVALQSRCGFFATVATRPSVGCTPAVNEADYKDYSSSFFAGLTGRDRLGNPAPSADYDQNGQITYAEAHAFAKVDEETTDWPISTSEAWLQRQADDVAVEQILDMPMAELTAIARPEQRYVVDAITQRLNLTPALSLDDNLRSRPEPEADTVEEAFHKRLRMELINIGTEQRIRDSQSQEDVAILNQILSCEASTWR